jgi:NAD-dependent SIR2 family protein deacetylase
MASTVDAKRVQEYSEASEDALESKLDQLADMVRKSKYTVFYTGAGMSTSAGVGDYRGPSGAWTQRRIKELQRLGHTASAADAEELKKLLAEQQKEQAKAKAKVPMTDAQPTLSHMMQATLIRQGLAHFVVTTNLDGIYRKSGLQAHEDVCFLHGDVYTERCTSCGYDFERNWHVRQSGTHVHDHSLGTCSRCGSKPPSNYTGKLKAGAKTGADGDGYKTNHLVGTRDVKMGTKDTHINFGEFLDERDWDEAEQHCSKADLAIVMGTSMSLRHITHFPFQAKKTVIVNLQKTPDDKKCHLRIWAQCDPVSAGLLARLGLDPMPVPVWRPRDALPLQDIPRSVSQPYREAAARLAQLITQSDEQSSVARSIQQLSGLKVSEPQQPMSIGNQSDQIPTR